MPHSHPHRSGRRRRRRLSVGGLAAAVSCAAAAVGLAGPAYSSGPAPLSGVLKLAPGRVSGSGTKLTATGTYFRMITPAGPGHYFDNSTSDAGRSTTAESYTLLAPGSAGGLKLGSYQTPPSPAFSGPNARASSIVEPESFVGIKFSISTAPRDAQAGTSDPTPKLYLSGTKITGQIQAWTAEWNRIYFNQGSPKPGSDGYPGLTRPVTGTYDRRTHGFVITWYSLIVGGPFNGFTGYWHLQGTLER